MFKASLKLGSVHKLTLQESSVPFAMTGKLHGRRVSAIGAENRVNLSDQSRNLSTLQPQLSYAPQGVQLGQIFEEAVQIKLVPQKIPHLIKWLFTIDKTCAELASKLTQKGQELHHAYQQIKSVVAIKPHIALKTTELPKSADDWYAFSEALALAEPRGLIIEGLKGRDATIALPSLLPAVLKTGTQLSLLGDQEGMLRDEHLSHFINALDTPELLSNSRPLLLNLQGNAFSVYSLKALIQTVITSGRHNVQLDVRGNTQDPALQKYVEGVKASLRNARITVII